MNWPDIERERCLLTAVVILVAVVGLWIVAAPAAADGGVGSTAEASLDGGLAGPAQSGDWCNRSQLEDYLTNFSGEDPVKAVACPFIQNDGAGMGLTVFALFFYGFLGLGMTVRTQHPGPLVVAGMMTVGVITLATPGIGAKIIAIVLFFGISALGMYLYQKAQSSL